MRSEQLALVQAWADTRVTLARWRRAPVAVVAHWAAISLAIAVGLLAATWALGSLLTPDLTPWAFPGITHPASLADYASILERNVLVLALHAFACIAGFIAGSSLPHA